MKIEIGLLNRVVHVVRDYPTVQTAMVFNDSIQAEEAASGLAHMFGLEKYSVQRIESELSIFDQYWIGEVK